MAEVGNKELGETKTEKAAAEEAKAVAEGELETADKGVADDSKKLQDLQQECMTKATDYETSQHSRSEELAALQKAKDILQEKTGGAASRSYSFVQVKSEIRTSTKNDQLKDRVLALVQGMANKEGDKMMSLLAQRVQQLTHGRDRRSFLRERGVPLTTRYEPQALGVDVDGSLHRDGGSHP